MKKQKELYTVIAKRTRTDESFVKATLENAMQTFKPKITIWHLCGYVRVIHTIKLATENM